MATMKNMNSALYVGSVIAAAAILIAVGVTGSALLITPHQVIASIDNTIEEEQRVAVGGLLDGNLTVSVNLFSPAALETQTGESITFYAPENSTEIHNVIFDLSNMTTISGNELPFILPQGADPEQLELAPPFNFGEFIIQEQQPDGRQAIITLNKAAYYPTVADQENNTRYLIDVEEHEQLVEEARQQGFFEPQNLSANYTLNGTEKVVSSGIILDVGGFDALFAEEEGEAANTTVATTEATTPIPPAEIGQENATTAAEQEEGGEEEFPPLPYPILNSFTVTFEQPGTYEYFCSFHPGMYGIVTVAGGEGEANMTVTTDATDANATTAATVAEQEGEEQQQQITPTIPPNPLFE
jgi:plastocyanin